jgi:UTP-glucose-1-phosphate uridylyltransferase
MQLKRVKKSGIENFLFITGRGKESIENYFDYSFELEERLKRENKFDYLKEIQEIQNLGKIFYIRQKEPKGLGDAIYLAKILLMMNHLLLYLLMTFLSMMSLL